MTDKKVYNAWRMAMLNEIMLKEYCMASYASIQKLLPIIT